MKVKLTNARVLEVSSRVSDTPSRKTGELATFVSLSLYYAGGTARVWAFETDLTADGGTVPSEGDLVDVDAYIVAKNSDRGPYLSCRANSVKPAKA